MSWSQSVSAKNPVQMDGVIGGLINAYALKVKNMVIKGHFFFQMALLFYA